MGLTVPERVFLSSDDEIVVLRDPGLVVPEGFTGQNLAPLQASASSGSVFFLEIEGPLDCRVDVYINEEIPAAVARRFPAYGGTFRLDLPSGALAIGVAEAWSPQHTLQAEPGSYLLQFRTEEFEPAIHDAEMVALVGKPDWRYEKLTRRLRLVGCLPLSVAGAFLLARQWGWLYAYALPAIVASYLPYLAMASTRRYRAIRGKMKAHEESKPHWIFTLMRSAAAKEIDGGFIRLD